MSHDPFTPIDIIPEVVRGEDVLRLVNRSPEVSGIQELISSLAPGVLVQIPILLPVSYTTEANIPVPVGPNLER